MIEVFIPFWGDPQLLMEAIESVRGQNVDSWRLTVVDDCYPDETVKPRVDALDDSRITYILNEENLGITDNYRKCISMASEEIVVLLGCDDIMLPNYISTIMEAAARFPQADIIQPGVEVIDENGIVISSLMDSVKTRLMMPIGKGPTLLSGEEAATSLLRANWLYWPSLAFRRETLLKHDFRDDFPIIQDLGLVIDIIVGGGNLLLYPKLAFRYRRHSASASSASAVSGERFVGDARYFRLAANLMAKNGWRRAARVARHHTLSRIHAATMIPSAIFSRNSKGAKTLLGHAISAKG